VLEGGCGRGQYVVHYARRGARMVGLDFATDTLQRLRRSHPALATCGGDVSRLPFRDGVFEAYYSGGVVEHFEAGPLPALREARRVLGPGGVLLVSVPYSSPLRRLLAFGKRDRRHVRAPGPDEAGDAGRRFFQYAFTRAEFTRLLSEAGFEVTRTQGYAIYWGLLEVPMVGRLLERAQRRGETAIAAAPPQGTTPAPARPAPSAGRVSMAKRLLVSEDDQVFLAGTGVRFLRWAAANMMMYVCTPATRL
jgi:SAM-dependent methyltransferase